MEVQNKPTIEISELKKADYAGSVQRLYYLKDRDDLMVCETTPGGSVFDVGTIFSIPVSDRCRAAVRHKIFTMLHAPEAWERVFTGIGEKGRWESGFADSIETGLRDELLREGALTHHVGMVDEKTGEIYESSFPEAPSNFVVVRRFQIIKPRRVSIHAKNLWDYSHYADKDGYVIPLENIFRLGLTSGSSIYRKYLRLSEDRRPDYLRELGLSGEMRPWNKFSRPIFDFTTKYEPEDRNLDLQEALLISGLSGGDFERLINLGLFGSLLVSEFFRELGLFLWDIKWEMAREAGKLVYVDTIDTDSVRVTLRLDYDGRICHVHINKQAMRDYYRIMHADWYEAVGDSKKLAGKTGESFLDILKAGQADGRYPPTPEVDPDFTAIQEDKFRTILDYLTSELSQAEAQSKLREAGTEEMKYYGRHGRFEAYCKLNSP